MKRSIKLIAIAIIAWFVSPAFGQSNDDPTGLPGDQFSLEGALTLFKKASSPEEFEKLLNDQDNHVNNLDLNDDGKTDYIKVIDKMDGDVHALVLQAIVSDNENQDVAVIEIEKDGKESAVLQIVGDEDIFGENVIVEPTDGDSNMKGKGRGPSLTEDDNMGLVVNVWFWPSIRFIYAPVYRPWISPWTWVSYPVWYRPWHPFAWAVWHPFRVSYRVGFGIAPIHRVTRAHAVYTPVRVHSVTVTTRHQTALSNYRVSHTRTTVTKEGPRGQVRATHTETTVKGPHGGKVKHERTTVRGKRN